MKVSCSPALKVNGVPDNRVLEERLVVVYTCMVDVSQSIKPGMKSFFIFLWYCSLIRAREILIRIILLLKCVEKFYKKTNLPSDMILITVM